MALREADINSSAERVIKTSRKYWNLGEGLQDATKPSTASAWALSDESLKTAIPRGQEWHDETSGRIGRD